MPDKKISEFQTFAGATGEDVFFVVASGETENSSAKNYKIPYNELKSDLGLDAGGGGSIIGGNQDNIDFGGTQPGDVRNINFQQGGENMMVINQDGDVNIKNDLTISGNIASSTGYFQEVIVSGDVHISGDLYVTGTTHVHEIIDTTVSGTISGYTGIFNTSSGKTGSFTESLTISGFSVLTGFEIPGGGSVIGGDEDNIDFGGTDPGDVRNINFQQGGENVMVINEDGDVNIQNDLTVTGNISGGIISGKTGVFTESLSVSGVSVLTGNQQASIQWLEDIGNGQLTVKESSIDGINFTNTKWYDTIQAGGDIYYNEGNVGVNNNNPQAELDVSGDIYSERIKIGNVVVYSDTNDNLVFDTE